MSGKLIPASEYRPLPPKLQEAFEGGFAEMRAKIRARQMRRVIPRTETTELDPESLHRAVNDAIAAGGVDGREP